MNTKDEKYAELFPQIKSILEGETDMRTIGMHADKEGQGGVRNGLGRKHHSGGA